MSCSQRTSELCSRDVTAFALDESINRRDFYIFFTTHYDMVVRRVAAPHTACSQLLGGTVRRSDGVSGIIAFTLKAALFFCHGISIRTEAC